MLWATLIIFASVLLGTALALSARVRDSWMGPLRTFALTAALSVVVIHLLPAAVLTVGMWGIGVFFLGLIAPELLGKAGEAMWRARQTSAVGPQNAERRRVIALEASYFGLLLHHIGDGVGLGAFTGEMSAAAGSGGVIVALSAHSVPVVAIMVLSFDSMHGRGSALTRALGLAIASTMGVWLSNSIPHDSFATASAYISAFVAGTLLHVVSHDLGLDLPKRPSGRLVDLVAAALGIYVSLVGGESHAHAPLGGSGHQVEGLLQVLIDLCIETGPLLILGVGIGALLTAWGPAIPQRFFVSRGLVRDAARGAVIGAPLPLCSCSVIPISAALVGRGAGPAMVVSFLLAAPELGVETFALSVRFLGWEFAVIRLVAALLLAFAAGVLLAALVSRNTHTGAPESAIPVGGTEGTFFFRTRLAFDELLHHIGAWMILGLVAAALLQVALPADSLGQVEGGFLQFLVVTLVAVPSYICAPSATPLAAVLIGKGISPGAVLVGLLLGPATNIATVVFLRRWFGARSTLWGLLGIVATAWMLGGVVDGLIHPAVVQQVGEAQADYHSGLWLVLAAISGLILLRALYKAGVRGFLSTLVGEHGHSHEPSELQIEPQVMLDAAGTAEPSTGSHSQADHDSEHGHGHGHGNHNH